MFLRRIQLILYFIHFNQYTVSYLFSVQSSSDILQYVKFVDSCIGHCVKTLYKFVKNYKFSFYSKFSKSIMFKNDKCKIQNVQLNAMFTI